MNPKESLIMLNKWLAGDRVSLANLTDAKFTGADLTSADLTGSNCTGTDFTGANTTFEEEDDE